MAQLPCEQNEKALSFLPENRLFVLDNLQVEKTPEYIVINRLQNLHWRYYSHCMGKRMRTLWCIMKFPQIDQMYVFQSGRSRLKITVLLSAFQLQEENEQISSHLFFDLLPLCLVVCLEGVLSSLHGALVACSV